MFNGNLKQVVEALLFVSDKPLTLKQVADVCEGAETADIKQVLQELMELYNTPEKGIQIIEVAGGYQFSTHPDCADYLKKLYSTRRVFRLSAPSLETLAIVAYKQPVTRAEIEFIRGVNVDGVIKTLEERELIRIKGRKEVPGKPILYGTTEEFLHYFGLKSLQDLPTIEEFTARALESTAQDSGDGELPRDDVKIDSIPEAAQSSGEIPANAAAPEEPAAVEQTEAMGKGNDYGQEEHSEVA